MTTVAQILSYWLIAEHVTLDKRLVDFCFLVWGWFLCVRDIFVSDVLYTISNFHFGHDIYVC